MQKIALIAFAAALASAPALAQQSGGMSTPSPTMNQMPNGMMNDQKMDKPMSGDKAMNDMTPQTGSASSGMADKPMNDMKPQTGGTSGTMNDMKK